MSRDDLLNTSYNIMKAVVGEGGKAFTQLHSHRGFESARCHGASCLPTS